MPRRPAMTEFRRRLRFHQAQWREAHGHPIGTQPIAPKPGQAGAARRKSAPARLRPRDRGELRHRRRARGGEGPDVDDGTSPELRSPAAVGRPPVVAGARLQPVRRPGGRPRARRPGRAHAGGRTRRAPCPRCASRTLRVASIRRTSTACARSMRRSCSTSTTGRRESSASRPSTTSGASRRLRSRATSRATGRSPKGRAPSPRERSTYSRGGRISP